MKDILDSMMPRYARVWYPIRVRDDIFEKFKVLTKYQKDYFLSEIVNSVSTIFIKIERNNYFGTKFFHR
jgi:hypothetical protein